LNEYLETVIEMRFAQAGVAQEGGCGGEHPSIIQVGFWPDGVRRRRFWAIFLWKFAVLRLAVRLHSNQGESRGPARP
jgi:hypothetical protein